MNTGVSTNGFGTEIGVAILAAVAAGVVSSDIQTFNTVAFETLIFIFSRFKWAIQ